MKKDQIPERGARMARRDDREYWAYLRKKGRRQPGCPARKVVLLQPRQATSGQAEVGGSSASNPIVALCANIIVDLERNEVLTMLHSYLDQVRVHYCRR